MNRAQSFLLPGPIKLPPPHWDGELAGDFFADCGTPALAVFDGVAYPQTFSLGGYTVRIVANDGTEAYFAHLADAGRASGRVSAGDVIGYVSDTGNAKGKGCHIHFAAGSINGKGGGTISMPDFFSGSSPVASPGQSSPPPQQTQPGQSGGIPKWILLLVGGVLVLEFLDE